MEYKNDVVTVVREDGKEFVIQRKVLAEHINRGFRVKDEKDQPSEEELSKAVGYSGPKKEENLRNQQGGQIGGDEEVPGPAPANQTDTVPEEKDGNTSDVEEPEDIALEDMTAAQLKAEAAALKLSTSGTKDQLKERISEAMESEIDKMVDHVVTEEDLAANPELAEEGVKVGDTIKLPKNTA